MPRHNVPVATPTGRRTAGRAAAVAAAAAPLVVACGVEYRPGASHPDSARAAAARAESLATAGTAARGRVDTVVRTDTVVDTVLVRDTLPALGDVPPGMSDTSQGARRPLARSDVRIPVTEAPDSAAANARAGAPAGATTGARTPAVTAADLATLRARGLRVPVRGVPPARVPSTFAESRGGGRRHEALDIPAPRGAAVVAAADGRVLKLFTSAAGGLTVYVLDPTSRFVYYYAHLEAYRPGLAEGQPVRAGDELGTVGSTGNANPATPHLHFAVARVADPQRWWEGTPVDPQPFLR
jgi:murein DD-endopeptidase MepM/ murein hydrolase activator NlpD